MTFYASILDRRALTLSTTSAESSTIDIFKVSFPVVAHELCQDA
jgi:hypothetical protein